MRNHGFTLIELIIAIILIAILAVVAAPQFLDFSKDAKEAALEQVSISVETANELLNLKAQMPSYSVRPVDNRDDLTDVDMNGDGQFDVFNPDSPDVRLKWFYLDNTDIKKRIELSDSLAYQEQGINFTYIGYSNSGNVISDNCYFRYTQASNANTPPQYQLITSGC